ncbi:hypothetical protein Dimus_027258 [Dionaea muscipula]
MQTMERRPPQPRLYLAVVVVPLPKYGWRRAAMVKERRKRHISGSPVQR